MIRVGERLETLAQSGSIFTNGLGLLYTQRKHKIRLISVRRANAEERTIYYGYIERRTIENPWSDAGL
jgi:uncharacterized DUF497 family protein